MATFGLSREAYVHGLRVSARLNATAFGYSILATASLAVVAHYRGAPSPLDVFMFLGGSAIAFTGMEAIVSGFFRKPVRGERSQVVVLGSAMNLISLSVAFGAIALIANAWSSRLVWLIGPFVASLLYLLIVGLEMALAHEAEE